MTRAYYNEIDPFAAAWLRELIKAGHIEQGEVDERSIVDVQPSDLRGFTQCHFFAGIGVWSYALRGAGWPGDVPVWTGSCPCQSFSASGKRGGFDDKRHLWPTWFRLIQECRPNIVFGEQVASADGLAWFDVVSSDLEATDYAVGAADICAAGFGAPHIRQRLYFVADTGRFQSERRGISREFRSEKPQEDRTLRYAVGSGSQTSGELADSAGIGCGRAPEQPGPARGGIQKRSGDGASRGFWTDADWLPCRDGKARSVEPGTFPLAHGAPNRVGRLRGYGNAINAEAAKGFIGAYLEVAPVDVRFS